MTNKQITTHAKNRYFERSNQEVSRKKIVSHIANGGDIIFAKRLTSTRSLAYIPIDDIVFKTVINRKSKIIVSILPFNDLFIQKFKIYSDYYDNKTYLIEIYPDCYNETKTMHTLTKIYEIIGKELKEIEYNHPFFEGLFKAVWKIHQGMKGLTSNETFIAKSKTGTIEFKPENTECPTT